MRQTTSLIAIAAITALTLSGCDIEESGTLSPEQESNASKHALDQLNSEKEAASQVLAHLQAKDATVKDAYFKLDELGQRTMVVTRDKADGSVETWEAPSEVVEQAFQSSQSATADSPGQGASASTSANQTASSGSNMMPILGGMLAGYMLANAFSSNSGKTLQMNREEQERRRSSATSTYASSTVQRARTAEATRSSFSGSRASSVGRSSGGSFSSSGGRAGGYGGGG